MIALPYRRYVENKTRRYVNGKRVRLGNPLHPLHAFYKKNGMLKTFEKLGLVSLTTVPELCYTAEHTFETVIDGDIYIINNPAWDGWFKVGMAIDATNRLKAYQTYSPYSDYRVIYKRRFKDRRTAESNIHKQLTVYPRSGEWYNAPFKTLKKIIDNEQNSYEDS